MKTQIMLAGLLWVGSMAMPASAQVVVLSPVPVLAPPMMVMPAPVPVVSAYRPAVPTYVAPAAYSAYRPAYALPPVPVAPLPAYGYGAVARYRTGVVGPGLGGFPSVYTPGQPVRNALRFVVP